MPHTPPDIILLDARTTATAGDALGIAGEAMRYGNNASAPFQDQWPIKALIRCRLKDSTSGASASVQIQTSPDNVTWTTIYTFVFAAIPAGQTQAPSGSNGMSGKLFTTNKRWIRANVSAIAGGAAPAVDCYLTLGTFGV